jgi:tetratricopeptide (TPR) repeat protein
MGRVVGNGFVNYDDETYVVNNSHVKAGVTPTSLWWALTATEASNWHPLTWISLQLDYRIFRLKASGYHLTNLLLHVANTLLVFGVFRWMTGAVWRSALAAGLFGLHPLHVESVAWVAERKDVLSTLFWMLTLAAYVHYVARPVWSRYALVVAAYALGLMAKPMLVTLPCVLLLLDYWPLCRSPGRCRPVASWLRLVGEKFPLFVLAAGSCWITLIAQHKGQAITTHEPLGNRVENAAAATGNYLAKTIWPRDLTAFYPRWPESLLHQQAVVAAVVLLSITIAVNSKGRQLPYLIVGWLWFLGTLVPVIGIVQVGAQAMADRYTYVAHIGLFVALAWGYADWASCWRMPTWASASAAVVALGGCAAMSWIQAGYWRDSITLWRHAIDVTDGNYLAHNNLGMAYTQAQLWSEAQKQFEKALELHPHLPLAEYNLGLVCLAQGQQKEAIEHLNAALNLDPEFSLADYKLGDILDQRGELSEALRHYEAVLRFNPDHAELRKRLGLVLIRQYRLAEAIKSLNQAVAAHLDDAELHDTLGLALALNGKTDEALAQYEKAVALQPGAGRFHYDLALALEEVGQVVAAGEQYRLGIELDPSWLSSAHQGSWVLATHPEAKMRFGPMALRLARQVCQATSRRQPECLDALAAAYAEVGRFKDAQAVAREALALAGFARTPHFADEVGKRLRLYEKNQAYHQERP